jgi:hypothetical protein
MANRKGPDTHHVVPNPSGGWDVRRGGASRASAHTDTKREAVDRGREISRNEDTELRIHNRAGASPAVTATVAIPARRRADGETCCLGCS